MNQSYASWLIVAGALSLTVAGFVWRRRSAPGGLALFVMLLSLTVWNWMSAGYWLSSPGLLKMIWGNLAFIGIVISTPAFLVMALDFTGRDRWLTKRLYGLLGVLSLISVLMLWSDPWHHLFFGGADIANLAVALKGGPWFWFYVAYAYALTLTGVILLGSAWLASSGLYRRQLFVFFIGIVLSLFANFMTLTRPGLFPGFELMSVSLVVMALLFAYGMFGLGLMDLVHISRDALVERLNEGIVVVDQQGRVADLNARALELADPTLDTPLGKPVATVFSRFSDLAPQFDVPAGRFEIRLPHSPFSILDVRITPLADQQGGQAGRLVTWYDVTVQKQAKEEMRLFRHAVDQSPTAIVITDPTGRIEYVNAQFIELTGYTLGEVRGKTPRVLKSGENPEELYSQLWTTITRGETWQAEIINRKKNGELYWADQLIAPVLNAQGRLTHFIAMQQDITLRKHNESELRAANTRLEVHLAQIEQLHAQLREESVRDGLTRLFNRRYMEETLEREFSRAERSAVPISAVMMDVDLFKSINDTYGHQVGDTVLQTLGTMLLENTRLGDIACRYGGDEVVVLMPDATLDVAMRRAEEWRAAFSLMEFIVGEERVRTSLSLGVASFPDQARNPSDLLLAADKALYRAKKKRNAAVSYDANSMSVSLHRSDEIR